MNFDNEINIKIFIHIQSYSNCTHTSFYLSYPFTYPPSFPLFSSLSLLDLYLSCPFTYPPSFPLFSSLSLLDFYLSRPFTYPPSSLSSRLSLYLTFYIVFTDETTGIERVSCKFPSFRSKFSM